MKQISLALVLLCCASPGRAQMAIVHSNDPQAHVYADSTWLGPASRQQFRLPAGTTAVRVVPNAVGAWGVGHFSETVAGRDTVHVEARFPYAYRLEAMPFAASVSLMIGEKRTLLCRTPLLLQEDAPLEGELVFEREGFAPVTLDPGDALWNRHQAVLQPLAEQPSGDVDVRVDVGGNSYRWVDYAAIGAALAGGALAVHYKLKADRKFDLYAETGDPALRPAIEDLDTRSAIALGAMQTGVTVFALRLVFR